MAALLCSSPTLADNWPNWRGPQHNGVAKGTFPVEWSDEKNLKWKIDLPERRVDADRGDDRIYVTCGKEGKNVLVAPDMNGKAQWEAVIGDERKGKHQKATGANPRR